MTATAAAPGLENVLYEAKGAIAYVTVNRPKVLNALNTRTWADLRAAFEQAREDPAVRGVILTGAGDKAFIAGADISELSHLTAVEARHGLAGRLKIAKPKVSAGFAPALELLGQIRKGFGHSPILPDPAAVRVTTRCTGRTTTISASAWVPRATSTAPGN